MDDLILLKLWMFQFQNRRNYKKSWLQTELVVLMKQKNVDSHEKTLKEIKQKEKRVGAENFENRFYAIFDRYYKDFVSGENTRQ